MLFCSIDSEAPGWKHGDLRKRKKLKGLPSIVFLEPSGDPLIYVPYQLRSVHGFRETGRRAAEYVRLRAATRKGDQAAAARFLRIQLEERQVTLADAVSRRVGVKADAGLAANLDHLILNLRISTEIRGKGQKNRHELGPRYYAMWTKGPKPGLDVSRGFWYAILEWAKRANKPTEFAIALAGMRQCLQHTDPDATWVPTLLARYEETLKKLRGPSERK